MTKVVVCFVLVLVVLSSSCMQTASSVSVEEAAGITKELTYVKDSRSKQCFAVVVVAQNGFTITWVPCTNDVETLIKK